MPIFRAHSYRFIPSNTKNATIQIKVHWFAGYSYLDRVNVRMSVRIDLPFPFANDKELDLERRIPMDDRGFDRAIAVQVGGGKLPYLLRHEPVIEFFERFQSKSILVIVR